MVVVVVVATPLTLERAHYRLLGCVTERLCFLVADAFRHCLLFNVLEERFGVFT